MIAVELSVLGSWLGYLRPFCFRKKRSDWLLNSVPCFGAASILSSPSTDLSTPLPNSSSIPSGGEISTQTTPDLPRDLTAELFTTRFGLVRTEGMLTEVSFPRPPHWRFIFNSSKAKFPPRSSARPCPVRLSNSAPRLAAASIPRLPCFDGGPAPSLVSIAISQQSEFQAKTNPDTKEDLKHLLTHLAGLAYGTEGMLSKCPLCTLPQLVSPRPVT